MFLLLALLCWETLGLAGLGGFLRRLLLVMPLAEGLEVGVVVVVATLYVVDLVAVLVALDTAGVASLASVGIAPEDSHTA
jgi:hypothetical protein